MDFVKKFTEGNNNGQNQQGGQQQEGRVGEGEQKKEGGGFLDGLGEKFNSAAGGGRESEKNEDALDKGSFFPFSPAFL